MKNLNQKKKEKSTNFTQTKLHDNLALIKRNFIRFEPLVVVLVFNILKYYEIDILVNILKKFQFCPN